MINLKINTRLKFYLQRVVMIGIITYTDQEYIKTGPRIYSVMRLY